MTLFDHVPRVLLLSSALMAAAFAKPAKCKASSDAPSIGHSLLQLQQPYYPLNAQCTEYLVPVSVEYENLEFNATQFGNDYDLTNFLTVATTRAGAGYPAPLVSTAAQGSYKIAASFCTPKTQTAKAKNVIVATHGIGPARAHWNSPYKPEEYNFVLYAVQQGYSVFFYDRLGCGASDKISGYKSSLFTAIAVLKSVVAQVKTGQYTGTIGKPGKVAILGFSFGSYTTHGAIASQPDLADAVVLTAVGFNETGLNANGLVRSFVPRLANAQNPDVYGEWDNGYLSWVDRYALVWNYFKQPNYEPAAADFVEAAKAPFSVTEFLTFPLFPTDASNYTGPVLAITGSTDYIVCDGYCSGIFEEPARTYYRNAKFTPYLHPGVSHHLNFHRNATGAFKVITDFLGANGMN